MVCGKVQRQFRFRAEAGYHLVLRRWNTTFRAVRNFQRANDEASGGDLIKKYLRGDAETAVDSVIVPDEGVRAVIDRCRGRGGART